MPGVGVAASALFAVTACPTIFFADDAELVAASACLGVAHPPGYPLFTLVGKLALMLPLGEPAWRMNLLSALFGGLACAAAASLVRRETGSALGAAAAGLILATSSTLWSVSTVAEVYSLHLLLVVVLLVSSSKIGLENPGRARQTGLLTGAAVLGAGLSHHPTIVLALPAAALLTIRRPRRAPSKISRRITGATALVAGGLVVAIPLVSYATLLLRSRAHPLSNWGRPETFRALVDHATAVMYRHKDLGWAALLESGRWTRLATMLLQDLSPAAWPLAAAGLVRLSRHRHAARLSARLALVALAAASVFFGQRYDVVDPEPYFLPAFAAVALAAGFGVAAVGAAFPRAGRPVAAVVAFSAIALSFADHVGPRNLGSTTAARDYGRDVLRSVPAGGVLFVEGMDANGVLYLTQVLGERTDVTVYDRNRTLFRDLLVERPVPPRRGESFLHWRNRAEQSFIDTELSRPDARAVLFLGWPGYEVPSRYRMETRGLLTRIRRAADPPDDTTGLWASYHEADVVAAARRTGDPLAAAVAATYPLQRGEEALRRGDVATAEDLMNRAAEMAGRTARLHSYIGTVWGGRGEYGRAIAALRRAVAIEPTNYVAWNNLALAFRLSGQPDEARRAWSRSLEIAPGQTDVISALAELDVGPRPAPPHP